MTSMQQTVADSKKRDLLKKLDKGICDMEQDRVITHEETMKRLRKMVKADAV